MPASNGGDQQVLSLPFMVRWFSPTLLANAALRAFVSPVLGTFADPRSSQANVDGFDAVAMQALAYRYDYSDPASLDDNGAVWVDYIADTGDGFDSTYAVASLVAEDSLTVARSGSELKHTLPGGQLLILGGDQVYPYPSRDEYRERFEVPFRMAFSEKARPRLCFAIPGNHDWYDGLNSFDFLFCQARYGQRDTNIGSLHLQQHRSYFAIKLPYNWWVLGCDIQFSDYLDAGQTRYFQSVAARMKEEAGDLEHKVIMCTAAPGWQYEQREAHAANSNLRIVAGIVEAAGAKICAVISGDTHHYSRYYSAELGLNLITAGGGGAFLHPTHQLYDDIKFRWQGNDHAFDLKCRPPADPASAKLEQAVFPSKTRSFWLTWRNIFFPIWNPTFATLLGTFYWLMTWMYSQTPIIGRENCQIPGRPQNWPLVEDILVYYRETCGVSGLGDIIGISIQAGVYQFLLGIFGLLLLLILIGYADSKRRWKKVLIGSLHWLIHLGAMVGVYILINRFGYWSWLGDWTTQALGPLLGAWLGLVRAGVYMLQMIVGGGMVAGFVWGFYLFFCCAFGRRHWDEAFSALRLPDYKNFLRMKIERERLTIYPIGVTRVPTRIEWRPGEGKDDGKMVPIRPMAPHLIDGPIEITVAKVKPSPVYPG